MRILSLLPSATEIMARLGLADSLVGRSNETWAEVAAADPELLVIAACGFDAAEAARRSRDLDLERIAPNARVVVVDGDSHYSRPGPRLADGVRQLGHLLHHDAVPDPDLPLIVLREAPLRV